MYYASTADADGQIFIIKKTMKELGKHYQRNLEAFGGNANAEYIVFRGKPSNKTYQGHYTLHNGRLKKKPSILETLLDSIFITTD
jgi:hypothetical protein